MARGPVLQEPGKCWRAKGRSLGVCITGPHGWTLLSWRDYVGRSLKRMLYRGHVAFMLSASKDRFLVACLHCATATELQQSSGNAAVIEL